MTYNLKNFNLKQNELIPVDELIQKILYTPKVGYYSKKNPFGVQGDFVTAPTISNLFSEIITIWIVSAWEKLGKPKKFNLVELGPGDGSFAKVLSRTLKKFPILEKKTNIFLYEKSDLLIKTQKKKLKGSKIKWIKNFNKVKRGPVIFFGNEFFDAIPIKQFLYEKETLFEKYYSIDFNSDFKKVYKKANDKDLKRIKLFRSLKGIKFIEFPKLGLIEMDEIVKKINNLSGGILLIDYGYLNLSNKSTLQAVMKNKKINLDLFFKNLGNADITSLVNFNLLKEYFVKKNLKVKNIVSQKFFLEKMGIIERANILQRKMNLKQKNHMFLTLRRLLHKDLMGELFKVIFAFKSKNNNFLGFN